MPRPPLSSDFIRFLAARAQNGGEDQLPSLSEVSKELGVSVALLREQLEVAKALGLVDVRPRTGIRRLAYTFQPAVYQSLSYAIAMDKAYFYAYSDLRNHLEDAFWNEAASRLTVEDQQSLRELVARAWGKLRGRPIQIPHEEHRQLHLMIYSRLNNPFVQGLLEAYWYAYEAVGLNLYTGYDYLQQVWQYHQAMVEAICTGDLEKGHQALVEHKDLLFHLPWPE
jgi:DNA-binding FadR family transcriptional regulator